MKELIVFFTFCFLSIGIFCFLIYRASRFELICVKSVDVEYVEAAGHRHGTSFIYKGVDGKLYESPELMASGSLCLETESRYR